MTIRIVYELSVCPGRAAVVAARLERAGGQARACGNGRARRVHWTSKQPTDLELGGIAQLHAAHLAFELVRQLIVEGLVTDVLLASAKAVGEDGRPLGEDLCTHADLLDRAA